MTKERKKEREEIIALLCSTDKEDRLLGLAMKGKLDIRFSLSDWNYIDTRLRLQLGGLKYAMTRDWHKTIRINSR